MDQIIQETSAIAKKPARRHVAGRSMHCLRDIRLRTVGDLETGGWSHPRSSKMPSFDSLVWFPI